MPRRFQNFSVCLGHALAKKTTEDSIGSFVYYLANGFGMPWHFAKGYDLVFKQLRLLFLPNYIVYLWNTWNGWNGRHYFSRWSPGFGFFVCLCYSRRTHYPTLENQVLKIYLKNKGKQRELSYYWQSINDSQKTKRLTGIQVLTKDFTSHKIR